MQIVDVKITDLTGADYNPRTLTVKEFDDLRDSIEKFGIVEPAVINTHKGRENIIVGGHQRIEVARSLGLELYPVVYVDLDEEEEKELNIRLNKSGGRWDFDKLANLFEIDDLLEWGFSESELLGRCDEILDGLRTESSEAGDTEATEEAEEEPEEYPEEQSPRLGAVSVRGDVWQCGIHRVMCGDSTQFGDIEKLLIPEEEIATIYAGKCSAVKYPEWWISYRSRAKKNANALIFGDARELWRWWYSPEGLEAAEHLTFNNEIVWDQMAPISEGSGARLSCNAERALYFTIGEEPGFYGEEPATMFSDIFRFSRDGAKELAKQLIKTVSPSWGVIAEPFGGAGATLAACQETGNPSRTMEISPERVDAIVRRWQRQTGERATHAETGQSFEELEASR